MGFEALPRPDLMGCEALRRPGLMGCEALGRPHLNRDNVPDEMIQISGIKTSCVGSGERKGVNLLSSVDIKAFCGRRTWKLLKLMILVTWSGVPPLVGRCREPGAEGGCCKSWGGRKAN